jgi:hypothetical protein
MVKKPLIVVSICAVVVLVLGSSVPALAKTQSFVSKTMPLISTSSAEDYKVYIGAGFIRQKGDWKFGLGWHMTIIDTGDTNVTGFFYGNETTLFGKVLPGNTGPFSLAPGEMIVAGSSFYYLHPLVFVHLTVKIGNMTYSKSGYEVGPFTFLVG